MVRGHFRSAKILYAVSEENKGPSPEKERRGFNTKLAIFMSGRAAKTGKKILRSLRTYNLYTRALVNITTYIRALNYPLDTF